MKNKGFTLVELLVVMAIIAILSTVVFAGIGGARNKAGVAAFKLELSSIRSMLLAVCYSGNITAADVGAIGTHSDGTINSQNCGVNSPGVFSVTFAPTNGVSGCESATITEAGVTYTACP